MSSILLQLFITFAKIGTFTLGGGYAMIPMIESEIVNKKQWLNKEEFLDILIVAQSAPGVFAINMASNIGYKIKGLKGGIIGSLGVAFPSILIILLIAIFFRQFQDNPYVERIFMGIRPAVVALIAAPVFTMAKSAKVTLHNIWIPIVAAVLISLFKVSPIWVILAAGLGGWLYGKSSGDNDAQAIEKKKDGKSPNNQHSNDK